jgi:HPt (histidine-containing phosphotransfer) domain-containing protein
MNLDEVMGELREEYLQSFDSKVKNLSVNLEKKEFDLIELEFHKMKGTGETYGIPEISQLGYVVEKICLTKASLIADAMPLALELINLIVKERNEDRGIDLKSHESFIKLEHLAS